MAGHELGPGERAARAKSRRIWAIFGVLFAGGAILGFVTSRVETQAADGGLGTLPPAFAIFGVALFLVLVTVGSLRYFKSIDEVEKRNNYVAACWALNLYLCLYPVWFFLWRGGLVVEPMQEVIYGLTMVTTIIVYGWMKFRA